MLKKIVCLVCGFGFAYLSMAEQYTYRTTVDGIEYLLTANPEEKWFCLEKAITLTADQYDMVINLDRLRPSWEYEYTDARIGASAFENNEYITSIAIEANSQKLTICEKAFKNCVNLRYFGVTVGALVSIEASAFEGCNAKAFNGYDIGDGFILDEFHSVGNSIWDGEYFKSVTNIGEKAFYNCLGDGGSFKTMKLDSIIHIGPDAFATTIRPEGLNLHITTMESLFQIIQLPASYTHIENASFRNCCCDIKMSEGIKSIGDSAFEGCYFVDNISSDPEAKRVKLTIPEGVESIGDRAFYGSIYTGLELPSTLKHIGNEAFLGYRISKGSWYDYASALSGTVTIPRSVESFGTDVFGYHPDLKKLVFEEGLKTVFCVSYCDALEEVVIPNTVSELPAMMFADCFNVKAVIPSSIKKLGNGWTNGKSGVIPKHLIFEGLPPVNLIGSCFLSSKEIWVSSEYKNQWEPYMSTEAYKNLDIKLAAKVDGEWITLGGKVISNAMRASDPTIMDIKYKVTSTKDKVNVRILAYKDGVRSFANVLPVTTFVDGTEANVGDGVAANVEHTVSWQVSKDWDADLAKVSVEVFVMEDNLLPLQLTTIPARNGHPSVTFSRNLQSSEKVMNALYWLYADKTSGLTLENGILKNDGMQLANGMSSSGAAVSYIYSKMGYGTLSGDTLKYVNNLMRSSISSGKFAVKEGAAE